MSQQLRRCAAAVASGGSFGVAGANAVFLARTVLKDLTEQLNPTQLLAFVELPPAAAAAGAPLAAAAQPDLSEFGEDANKSLVAGLARSALQVLAANPVLRCGWRRMSIEGGGTGGGPGCRGGWWGGWGNRRQNGVRKFSQREQRQMLGLSPAGGKQTIDRLGWTAARGWGCLSGCWAPRAQCCTTLIASSGPGVFQVPSLNAHLHTPPCARAVHVLPRCSSGSYLVQLEVIHLLLVLCSTQLFTPSARAHLGAHPYMEAIMQVSLGVCMWWCEGGWVGQGAGRGGTPLCRCMGG